MEKKIIAWIRENVRKSKARGVVFGLSGGLDSAVVAALARKALGKKRVLALMMPCCSQPQDLSDAQLICSRFDIRSQTLELSPVYNALTGILPKGDRISQANLRPRLRMTILYYFARVNRYLVCGTSNKSEILSGYFTKFGDGASDLLPLGDLFKTQVRELAESIGIPRRIIDKAPTAGLWAGQTDEDELGITYTELDDILERMQGKRKQVLPSAKVRHVKKLMECSEHKRRPAAVFKLRN